MKNNPSKKILRLVRGITSVLVITMIFPACQTRITPSDENHQFHATRSVDPTTINPTDTHQQATSVTVTPVEDLYPPEWWQNRWLRGEPCSPPCWENIIPRKTTFKEAMDELGKIPFINSSSIRGSVMEGMIYWEWMNGEQGGEIFLGTGPSGDMVQFVRPFIFAPIRLQTVIEKFGEPSDVEAVALGIREGQNSYIYIYTLRLIYRSYGIIFGYLGNPRVKPTLSEETIIKSKNFYFPNDDQFLQSRISPNLMSPWQGFKSFDEYCKDRNMGMDCSH
jgi:hypothetical protein